MSRLIRIDWPDNGTPDLPPPLTLTECEGRLRASVLLSIEPRAQAGVLQRLKAILSTGSPLVPESFDYVYASIKADVQLASISGGTDPGSAFLTACPTLPPMCCGPCPGTAAHGQDRRRRC